MKRLLKTQTLSFAVIVAIFFTSTMAMAQQKVKQGPPPVPSKKQIEKMLEELKTKLSLTEYQNEKISAIYTAHFRKMDEMIGKEKDQRSVNHAQMKELRTSFEKEVKTILTKKQKELFNNFMKEKEQQHGKKKSTHRTPR